MQNEYENPKLENIPADRAFIQHVYEQGKLNRKARDYALELVCPPLRWGDWAASALLKLGFALILISIHYFFAFNWLALPAITIFLQISLAILAALFAVYYFGLQSLTGRLALLSASVLVGAFLFVFGQKYQIGIYTYTLFMWWSILTFVWTVMSCYAVQWFFWIMITNMAIILWEKQFAVYINNINPMLVIYLGLFNLGMLALREYGLHVKAYSWLQSKWPALLTLGAILLFFVLSINLYIEGDWNVYIAIFSSAAIICLFIYYRYIHLDMPFLVLIVIAIGAIIELILVEIAFSGISKGFIRLFVGSSAAMSILLSLMALSTLALCVVLIKYLRHLAKIGQV